MFPTFELDQFNWSPPVRMNPVQDQEEEEELRRNPLLKIVIAVWSYCVDRWTKSEEMVFRLILKLKPWDSWELLAGQRRHQGRDLSSDEGNLGA